MLSFNDVACRRDGKLLFSQISCVIHAGQKVGLTGANGCGKSSLFAMIQGHLEPDTGSITRPQNVGITHVAQEMPNSDSSALDYVVDGDQMLRKLEAAISACGDQDGERIATLLGSLNKRAAIPSLHVQEHCCMVWGFQSTRTVTQYPAFPVGGVCALT